MTTARVPVEDADLHELARLCKELKGSRSDVARRALAEGLNVLKLGHALARYEREEVTLGWAAEFVEISISEMADLAAAQGIPYFRYSPEELEEDAERARAWVSQSRVR